MEKLPVVSCELPVFPLVPQLLEPEIAEDFVARVFLWRAAGGGQKDFPSHLELRWTRRNIDEPYLGKRFEQTSISQQMGLETVQNAKSGIDEGEGNHRGKRRSRNRGTWGTCPRNSARSLCCERVRSNASWARVLSGCPVVGRSSSVCRPRFQGIRTANASGRSPGQRAVCECVRGNEHGGCEGFPGRWPGTGCGRIGGTRDHCGERSGLWHGPWQEVFGRRSCSCHRFWFQRIG